ncbi:hypothetical protein FQN50_008643 [Emmonsiellopsis sp. PD_5]|nr:hypothetical protein FQN50_008643 [Emmonsiellopsis sp. PD_5]
MDKLKSLFHPPPSFKVITSTTNPQSIPQSTPQPESQPQTLNLLPPPQPARSPNPPRILVIGAGSRGKSYATAITHSSNGIVAAVAEPVEAVRKSFGRRFIWGLEGPKAGEEFGGWREFVEWEVKRRERREKQKEEGGRDGDGDGDGDGKGDGKGDEVVIDGVLVCTLDSMHREIIEGLAPLGLHVLSEKPLATGWEDCLGIYRALKGGSGSAGAGTGGTGEKEEAVFAIGHVLRYMPYNMLLHELVVEQGVVGEVVSVDHMESVGWWHFAHSYVRGNWRKESVTAPTLLTKSCHDIDFLLWLLCSSSKGQTKPHLPDRVSASGSLNHFKKKRKPARAQGATNCLSCPIESECKYSSWKIYYEGGIKAGLGGWPVNIVLPDIEDYFDTVGLKGTEEKLREALSQDYDATTMPAEEIEKRPWYGRCVYESDNNVCDDQTVTISWEDDDDDTPVPGAGDDDKPTGRTAKTATFHMTAFSEPICVHQTRIYGTRGEIEADRIKGIITVRDFATHTSTKHRPHPSVGGHGGGDHGLIRQFVLAIDDVKNHGVSVEEAQRARMGCTTEDILRSHAMVFAAEEARKGKKVVDWEGWWRENVGEW